METVSRSAAPCSGEAATKEWGMPAVLAELLRRPQDCLRQSVRYTVQISEDGRAWEVVTEVCCLGGCDMAVYAFQSERDALLFAALLDAVGYRPPHNIACPDCFAAYQREIFEGGR